MNRFQSIYKWNYRVAVKVLKKSEHGVNRFPGDYGLSTQIRIIKKTVNFFQDETVFDLNRTR
jgi:hypothetical protein